MPLDIWWIYNDRLSIDRFSGWPFQRRYWGGFEKKNHCFSGQKIVLTVFSLLNQSLPVRDSSLQNPYIFSVLINIFPQFTLRLHCRRTLWPSHHGLDQKALKGNERRNPSKQWYIRLSGLWSGTDLISNNSNQTFRFWKIILFFGTCQVPVLDHWWQTETSHAITSTCVGLGHDLNPPVHSSGKPVPGYDVRILRQDGSEANDGEFGRCGHLFNFISLSLLTATLSCE